MSKRGYIHGCGVFVFSDSGALLIARGTYYTNGVPWMVCIGICLAALAAAIFTSAVTTDEQS